MPAVPFACLTLLLHQGGVVGPQDSLAQGTALLAAEDWEGTLALLEPAADSLISGWSEAEQAHARLLVLQAAAGGEEMDKAVRAAEALWAGVGGGEPPAWAADVHWTCLSIGHHLPDALTARSWFQRADAWADSLPNSDALRAGKILFGVAEQELGHYLEAERLFVRAALLAAEAGDVGRKAEAERLLASLLVDVGRPEEASLRFETCVAAFAAAELPMVEVQALGMWAWCEWDLGHHDAAAALVAAMLARETELDPNSLRLARTLEAELANAAGRYADARRAARQALAAIGLGTDPERRIQPILALAHANLAEGDFAAVEAHLSEISSIFELPNTARRGDAASHQRARYADAGRLAQDLAAARLAGAAGPDERNLLLLGGWTEVSRWKARGLLDRLAGPAAISPSEPAAAWLARLGRHRPNATLLEYAFGRDRLYVWRWHRSAAELFDLGPRAPIVSAVRRYREHLADPALAATLAEIVSTGLELHNLLIQPCMPADAGTLLVAPDGELASIPFGALISAAGAPAAELKGFAQVRFLADDHAISQMPAGAAAAMLAARSVPNSSEPRGVLALANPEFPDARWKALPGTAAEADALRVLRPTARILTRAQATRGAFLAEDLRDYGIVHFATHGTVHPFDCRYSRIACAGSGEASDLTLADVLGCQFDGALVVLSACDTGGGMLLRGEGVQSLADAFLRAGAGGVVASLWPVRDDESARLMASFYAGLLHGSVPIEEALRSAELELAGRSSEPLTASRSRGVTRNESSVPEGGRLLTRGPNSAPLAGHPGIWSPFVYYGPGGTPPPTR